MKYPKLIWKDDIGLSECPYMRRWVLDFGLFSIRLHRWERSDDARAHHDHSWWFLTLVLIGSYVDISDYKQDKLTAGSIRYRSALHRHTVKILKPGTWTLLLTGPVSRRWSFFDNKDGKAYKRDKWFAEHGHHPCNDGDPAVRMKPDGTRIK